MKRFTLVFAMLLALMGGVVVQAQDTATPEPTVEPAVEATQAPAQSSIRFAHWAPDGAAVDVYVDGQAVYTKLLYLSASDYLTFPSGAHSIAIVPDAGTIDQAVFTTDIDLAEGSNVTYAVVGSMANGTLMGVVAHDDFSPIPFGDARLYVYHTIEGAGNVDVFLGEDMVITELGYPGTFTDINGNINDGAFAVDVPAGTYDISVRATVSTAVTGLETAEPTAEPAVDATDTVIVPSLITLPGTVLEAGTIYTIALVGTPDAPSTFRISMAGTVAPQPSALDVALNNADFSILAAAVQAADPAIGEMLAAEGDFTLFAPTNAAFDAMLTRMNMTTDDLFANTELLNAVLRYHVVAGRFDAAGLTVINGQTLPSAQGEPITVTVNETGGVVLNGTVNVINADVGTSNGIVHVIDGVLIPPTMMPVQ